jgi:hypothetical protein
VRAASLDRGASAPLSFGRFVDWRKVACGAFRGAVVLVAAAKSVVFAAWVVA